MNKFTPGPWRFAEGWALYLTTSFTSNDPKDNGFRLEVGKNAGRGLVKYDQEWAANAILAQAAPDMYEALQLVNLELTSSATAGKVRAALSKAEGLQ